MPIYALDDVEPDIATDAFVHPDAVIIGEVTIGSESSVWPGAVLRGDPGGITIGARTSIQDGTVIHTTPSTPTRVGDDCTVGHLVHLEGCVIGDGSLIGSGSIVLNGATVEDAALVAAAALIAPGMTVPSGAMAMGVPAKIKENNAHADHMKMASGIYVTRGRQYRESLRRIG